MIDTQRRTESIAPHVEVGEPRQMEQVELSNAALLFTLPIRSIAHAVLQHSSVAQLALEQGADAEIASGGHVPCLEVAEVAGEAGGGGNVVLSQ